MELSEDVPENVGGRDRLVRVLLAVVLTVAAIRSLKNGKRVRGLLAGIGALVFGFNATTKYCGANDVLGIDTSGDGVSVEIEGLGDDDSSEPASEGALTCANCGEPIVPGQRRGPNDDDEIVHDACE
jgi:hypothetical protein